MAIPTSKTFENYKVGTEVKTPCVNRHTFKSQFNYTELQKGIKTEKIWLNNKNSPDHIWNKNRINV